MTTPTGHAPSRLSTQVAGPTGWDAKLVAFSSLRRYLAAAVARERHGATGRLAFYTRGSKVVCRYAGRDSHWHLQPAGDELGVSWAIASIASLSPLSGPPWSSYSLSTRAMNGIRMWPVAASGALRCGASRLEVNVPGPARGCLLSAFGHAILVKVEALEHWSWHREYEMKKSKYVRYNIPRGTS
ncbi:hypothetical protein K466DRAFT_67121 [Polyporus arcularius HHB13444]|uniref:Uncharacterized protein n=1 Tax=Polyporus arcularius HHB13444 TaxID=1314778 RepID=A0A5C3PFK1_9APHY|nr:hypothetical protein K466DRAFT_67121 [Polyporus arcularius HHB13444]